MHCIYSQALYFHSSLNDVTCVGALEVIALGRYMIQLSKKKSDNKFPIKTGYFRCFPQYNILPED